MSVPVDAMALDEWRARAKAGDAPAAILRKQYLPDVIKAEADSRKVSFTISTGAVDRDRDTLKADGWRLDTYRKNPVVLWAHQRGSLPIARAEMVGVSSGALKARAEFVPAEDYPFADTVYRLLKGGFLRATSVGFLPIEDKYEWNEDRDGIDFTEQELVEFSIVPVPSNPEALMDAKAAGVDIAPLKAWAERTLDELSDEPGLWVPKVQAEAALKALAEPRVVVPDWAPKAFDLAILIGKRGRVLSSENETRLRTAREHGGNLVTVLDEVLDQVAQYAEDDDKSAAYDPLVLVMPDAPLPVEAEPAVLIDPKELEAVIVASTREAVAAEFRRASGRLD